MSDVAVVPIPAAEKQRLWDAMQLYIPDFAPFDSTVPRQGPYDYPYLDAYWSEEGRWPFWAKRDGQICGFALVRAVEGVTEMSEFWIDPAQRRGGIGLVFARAIIGRFPGPWKISQYAAKTDAVSFWRRAIEGRPFSERDYLSDNGNARIEQSFTA